MLALYYSFISLVALIIHCIVNHTFVIKSRGESILPKYKSYLASVMSFYVIDAICGFLYILKNETLLYLGTTAYYLAMMATVVLCCRYVIAFLRLKKDGRVRFLYTVCALFMLLMIGLIAYNFFDPIFYRFDSNGNYQIGPCRRFLLYIQICQFGLTSFFSYLASKKKTGFARRRNIVFSMFALAMTIAFVLQILLPFFPIYSAGLLISNLMIHVFVHEEEMKIQIQEIRDLNVSLQDNQTRLEESTAEQEAHIEEITSLNTTLNTINADLQSMNDVQAEHLNIIGSLSNSYICIYYIDLTTFKFYEITQSAMLQDVARLNNADDGNQMFMEQGVYHVMPEFADITRKFCDLTTVADRLKDESMISYHFIGTHGMWREGSFIVSSRDANGVCDHVLWTVRDINEQKTRDESYHKELLRLTTMMSSSGIGTWQLIIKEGCHPRLVTDAKMRELMGMPKDTVISDEDAFDMLVSRIHEESRDDFARYDERLQTGEHAEVTYKWVNPMLGDRYVRCGGIAVKADDCLMFNGYHSDVTEQVEREKQLEISIAANKAKTKFLQNMSHEIRTPLNSMFGFAQLLGLPDGSWTEEEKEVYNGYIYNAYNMLDMLISDILDSANADSGNYHMEMNKMSVNGVCRNAMMTVEFRRPGKVQMQFTTEFSDDYSIISDDRRVQQVLVNYLTNACKNTLQGTILLHCSKTENPGKITFSVTDTGKGVPVEKAEEIFGRFTKLDQNVQGSGLGLNICHTIAEKLGGSVYLDTTYTAGGARFVFELDIKD